MTDNVVLFPKNPPIILDKKRTRKPRRVEKELRQCLAEYPVEGLSGVIIVGIPKRKGNEPVILWSALDDIQLAQACLNEAVFQMNTIRMSFYGYEDVDTGDE